MALTERDLDRLVYDPAGPAQQVIYDGSLPGFGVRLYPTGAMSFVVRYRAEGNRNRFLTLGKYGVLTLAEVRERARRALSSARDGADPLGSAKRRGKGLRWPGSFRST